MTRNILSIIVLITTLHACKKSKTTQIYTLDENITAVWNKDSEMITFNGLADDVKVVSEIRGRVDTLSASNNSMELNYTSRFTFVVAKGNETIGEPLIINRVNHKGMEGVCKYNSPDAPHNGVGYLNDGLAGFEDINRGEWVGWKNEDAVIEYEFNEPLLISSLSFRYRDNLENDIFPPRALKLEASVDGSSWGQLINKDLVSEGYPISLENIELNNEYKKLRLTVYNHTTSKNPESWLLIDEFMIYQN